MYICIYIYVCVCVCVEKGGGGWMGMQGFEWISYLYPTFLSSHASFWSHNLVWLVLINCIFTWKKEVSEKPHLLSVKKHHVFYKLLIFITLCTRAEKWFLFSARWVQPTYSHPISVEDILMLSSSLCINLISDFPVFSDWIVSISHFYCLFRLKHPPLFARCNSVGQRIGRFSPFL